MVRIVSSKADPHVKKRLLQLAQDTNSRAPEGLTPVNLQ